VEKRSVKDPANKPDQTRQEEWWQTWFPCIRDSTLQSSLYHHHVATGTLGKKMYKIN
jgi:hypothetical protein